MVSRDATHLKIFKRMSVMVNFAVSCSKSVIAQRNVGGICRSLRSWGHLRPLFSKFVLRTQIFFLVFHHLPTCIISLMNTKKHVFGMYVFVYLVICVS